MTQASRSGNCCLRSTKGNSSSPVLSHTIRGSSSRRPAAGPVTTCTWRRRLHKPRITTRVPLQRPLCGA
eukprot:6088470-Karenia_brevis.AAC.1